MVVYLQMKDERRNVEDGKSPSVYGGKRLSASGEGPLSTTKKVRRGKTNKKDRGGGSPPVLADSKGGGILEKKKEEASLK